MDAKFLTPDLFIKFLYLIYLKIFEKIFKNFLSQKPKRFEQSNFEARFATPESTLTAPSYGVENFNFRQVLIYHFFDKTFEKIIKKVKSWNIEGFDQSFLEAQFATPEKIQTEIRSIKPKTSIFVKFLYKFLENF